MLSDPTIHAVFDAAIALKLDRNTLLASLPRDLTAGFGDAQSARDQLFRDLHELKKMGFLQDGSLPLKACLTTALNLARPRREASVFQSALVELEAAVEAANAAEQAAKTAQRGAGRSSPGEEPTHTAIVLDRIVQWDMLVKRCRLRDKEHLAFVVHGSMEQDLHLFLLRIGSYLNEESGFHHSIVKVERSRDGTSARSADEWKRSLVQASVACNRELDFVFHMQAQDHPALFVLTDNDGPLRNLDKAAVQGLVRFFSSQVDSALMKLGDRNLPKNPVRFVIPLEHPPSAAGGVDPTVQQVQNAIRSTKTLRLEQLPPLEMPTWPEVEGYINHKYPHVDAHLLKACASVYNDVLASGEATLQYLGDAIHEALMDGLEDHHLHQR